MRKTADPTQFSQIFFIYFWSQLCKFKLFYLSHQSQRYHTFDYFGLLLEILYKKVGKVYHFYHMPGIGTDPERPTRSGSESTTLARTYVGIVNDDFLLSLKQCQ